MILVTGAHRYTHVPLTKSKSYDFRISTYNRAFRAKRLPRATYIFSDLDRLGFWELELSSRVFRYLKCAGTRVLNDPGRVRQRFSLLRLLRERQFNDFSVARVDDGHGPVRFPVFLRTESAHRGPVSDLLNDQEEIEAAVERALAKGIPRKDLLLVEYCAEPIAERIFRKLSVYRIGSRMVPSVSVHESRWTAKDGELGIAGEELYEDERSLVLENRYGDQIRPAFELGEIDYGRADFGIVGGRPQVYEINTNPTISTIKSHPFPARVEAARLCSERFDEAMAEIDTPESGFIQIDDEVLVRQRKYDRWMSYSRWTV